MFQHLKKTFDHSATHNSLLWQLMQTYYHNSGIDAWANAVPYIVTNLRATANMHADLILHHLYKHPSDTPYTVVDFGAGLGQHGFYLAKRLQLLLKEHKLSTNVQVILADLSPHCLSHWRTHPDIGPLIETQLIKTMALTGNLDEDLQMLQAKNTNCVILNYLLDSLPFTAVDNQHLQNLKLSAARLHLSNGVFNGPLSAIDLQFTCSGSKPTNHNQLLSRYQDIQRYSIPSTAIKLIRTLLDHNTDLILINDKGYLTPDEFNYNELFNIDLEGCFSTDINFDAILHSLPENIHTKQSGTKDALIKSLVIGKHPLPPSPMLCADIAAWIKHFKHAPALQSDLAMALLKTLDYDPYCLEILSQNLKISTSDQRLFISIQQCLANRFKKSCDFSLLHAARIYRSCGAYEQSLACLNLYAEDNQHPALDLELGIHYASTNPSLAKQHLNKAAKDPKLFSTTKKLLDDLHKSQA